MLSKIQQEVVNFLETQYSNYKLYFDKELLCLKVYTEKLDHKLGKITTLLYEFCLKSGICKDTKKVSGLMYSASTSSGFNLTTHQIEHNF